MLSPLPRLPKADVSDRSERSHWPALSAPSTSICRIIGACSLPPSPAFTPHASSHRLIIWRENARDFEAQVIAQRNTTRFDLTHTTIHTTTMATNASDEATRGRDPVREDVEAEPASEQTPLLSGNTPFEAPDQSQPQREHSASGLLRALSRRSSVDLKSSKRRWPSLLALLLLCILAVLIMVFAFITPSIVEKYAQQAVVFEPTSLSIDSFTADGVKARVQGDFMLDASKVEQKNVRNMGRLATWFASEIKTGESDVEVSLPEYGNVVLGTAEVPPIKVSIRNGHKTHVDFLSDLQPGDVDGIRRIAKDWVDGRLGQLRVLGKANVPLKSGIFSLGKQLIEQEITFANNDIPTIPRYKIEKLNFREVEIPTGKGMAADVALLVENKYPVDFTIPPLGFGILVDNCQKNEPYIMLADALTHNIHIRPQLDVELNVTGTVRQLPDNFIQACPGSHESPLDAIIGKYMRGKDTTIYVQGSDSPSEDTPQWVADLMKDITVPVSLPGRTFGSLIKNFTLDDTHFGLPDPFADPNSPESNPRISGNIKAIVALPEEMNFNISVGRVRADADVFYKKKKLGKLNLHKWQQANSTRLEPDDEEDGPSLLVQSQINEAPLEITDNDVFTDVVQALLLGSKSVFMDIKAEVDVETETALGAFAIRKIPAAGQVPIKRRS